jgi:predicted outer membrane lipoprotein
VDRKYEIAALRIFFSMGLLLACVFGVFAALIINIITRKSKKFWTVGKKTAFTLYCGAKM